MKKGGDIMPITFAPMRRYMADKGISYYHLANQGIDAKTLHRLRHDMTVTTRTIDRLCAIMHCTPADLMDYQEAPQE